MANLKLQTKDVNALANLLIGACLKHADKVTVKTDPSNIGWYTEELLNAFVKAYEVKKIGMDTRKRCLWDVLWASDPIARRKLFDSVYVYANDDNVYSALNHVFKNAYQYGLEYKK